MNDIDFQHLMAQDIDPFDKYTLADLKRARAMIEPRSQDDIKFLIRSFQQLIKVENLKQKTDPDDDANFNTNDTEEQKQEEFKNAATRK